MNYYRYLVKKGIQFDFVCMYPTLAYQEEIAALGGKIYYVSNVKKRPGKYKKELMEILKTNFYQIVYVNMLSAANVVPLQVAYEMRIPRIIAHSHNTMAPGMIRNVMHKRNLTAVRKYATDYWACGKEAAVWLFGSEGSRQAVIIPNAIEVEKFLFCQETRKRVRKGLDIGDDMLVIGHVGRMEEQKNHSFLLEIFASVHLKKKDSVLLLIGDGKLKEEIQEKARQLGISQQVLFLGRRNDVPDLLSAMDVFVFPSLYEGLSVTAVEAQCAGLPCVVSTGLTEDTAIMDTFQRISLEEKPDIWAEQILEYGKNLHNTADNDKIRKRMIETGFEIQTESEKLYRMLRK